MTPPEPKQKPKLAQWLFDRSMTYAAGADLFGCSLEHVRNLCRAVDDPKRQNPSLDLAQTISDRTGGDIGLDDWPPLAGARRRRGQLQDAAA